jgi:parallel beta-helix repeat protein
MKLKRSKHQIFKIFLFLFLFLINVHLLFNVLNSEGLTNHFPLIKDDTLNTKSLRQSGFWDENDVAYIHISADNWSAQDLPWIQNRTGTWEDPHVIENVTIDGTGREFGIKVENSKEFYIIRNVTIYDAGMTGPVDAALILNSANNSRIYGNNFSNNLMGIRLIQSYNNNISGNELLHNQYHGLRIEDNSDLNSIYENNIRYNLRNGMYLYTNCDNNSISRNIVSNNSRYGILIEDNSNKNIIKANTVGNNSYTGIFIYDDSDRNIVLRNKVYNNLYFGICIQRNSDNNSIIENIVNLNSWAGICIIGGGVSLPSYHNTIDRNIIKDNNDHGIDLRNYVFTTVVSRNIIIDNDYSGIALRISDVSFNSIWGNLFKDNKQYGTSIEISSATDNDLYQNAFIGNLIKHASDNGVGNNWNNSIMGNYWDNHSSIDATYDGIWDDPYDWISGSASSLDEKPLRFSPTYYAYNVLIDDDGNGGPSWSKTAELNLWCTGSGTWTDPYIIDGLEIDGNGTDNPITIRDSTQYFILQNCYIFNSDSVIFDAGIRLQNTDNGMIVNNNISNNNENGIFLLQSDNNTFIGNHIELNDANGIFVYESNSNLISGNSIANNSMNGILIDLTSDFNNITNNIIANNSNYGVHLKDGNIDDMFIYNNRFYNTNNAQDDSALDKNHWDNGTIGNYYDDYITGGGYDANDDGIGDIAYNIAGSAGEEDTKPICDDGDDKAPEIEIVLPSNNTYHSEAPTFQITLYDYYSINATWYSIYSGAVWSQEIPFTGNLIFLNQTLWNGLIDGVTLIKFSVNDSAGHYNCSEALIVKDTTLPTINILSPGSGQICGANAPSFTVEIDDLTLNETWYILNSGTIKYNFTSNETINSVGWANLLDGNVNITFYANDSIGQIKSLDVIIIKDTGLPSINIISPITNQVFGVSSPRFTVEISDPHLNKIWYIINSGTTKYFFTQNDTLDNDAWENLLDGNVEITFYANDSAGNEYSVLVTIIKDTTPPEEEDWVIWVIRTIIGGIISAASGLTVKIVYSRRKKWKTFTKGASEYFTKIPDMEQYLKNQLGAQDWSILKEEWTKYQNGLINQKEFLKYGRKKLGKKFNNCFIR